MQSGGYEYEHVHARENVCMPVQSEGFECLCAHVCERLCVSVLVSVQLNRSSVHVCM